MPRLGYKQTKEHIEKRRTNRTPVKYWLNKKRLLFRSSSY